MTQYWRDEIEVVSSKQDFTHIYNNIAAHDNKISGPQSSDSMDLESLVFDNVTPKNEGKTSYEKNPSEHSNKRVLVVDDDYDSVFAIKTSLENHFRKHPEGSKPNVIHNNFLA